jgi:ribosomal protein S17E
MGRIKSKLIKNASKEMLAGKHSFNTSFEHNKKMLKDTMPSKSLRNKIAGYIARLMLVQKTPEVPVAPVVEKSE